MGPQPHKVKYGYELGESNLPATAKVFGRSEIEIPDLFGDGRLTHLIASNLDVMLTKLISLWFSHEDLTTFFLIGATTDSHQSLGIFSLVQFDPRCFVNSDINTAEKRDRCFARLHAAASLLLVLVLQSAR